MTDKKLLKWSELTAQQTRMRVWNYIISMGIMIGTFFPIIFGFILPSVEGLVILSESIDNMTADKPDTEGYIVAWTLGSSLVFLIILVLIPIKLASLVDYIFIRLNLDIGYQK